MKIELRHPINHDEVEYGRGLHAVPDRLAKKLIAEAPEVAVLFDSGAHNAIPGSITLPPHISNGEMRRKILGRIDELQNQRRRLMEVGLTEVGEIDGDIDVLGWQLRCLHCGNTSELTLDDHLREWNRSKRATTHVSELTQETEARGASKRNRPSVRDKNPTLPPKRQDLSQYFDAAKLTEQQRDYLSLKFEHEMPVASIARLRRKHHSTVQETLKRAEAKLNTLPNSRLVSDRIRCGIEDEILRRIDRSKQKGSRSKRLSPEPSYKSGTSTPI
jgi:predicted DNA-binding protein YlxM (UPF0122 family)